MKRIIRYSCLLILVILNSCGHEELRFPVLNGNYPVKSFPSEGPELFGAGIISTGLNERDITFSPDGSEIFYGLSNGRMVTIMYTRFNGRRWEEPVVAPFAYDKRFAYFEPCFAPDGKSVYFLTTKPVRGKEIKPGWTNQNIFVSDRNEDGTWGDPYDPLGCINDGSVQFYPSMTKSRTLYFCRTDPATGKHALYMSPLTDGLYSECIKLPEPVNTDTTGPYNVFVSPDESFMIACIAGIRVDYNPDRANYFLFINDGDGNWSGPVPFGPEINIPGSNAMSSSMSHDMRYLFFAAQVSTPFPDNEQYPVPLSLILRSASSPQNGNYDIYWTDAEVITETIREFKKTGNN